MANINDLAIGDPVLVNTHQLGKPFRNGKIVALSPPGWVDFRDDEDGKIYATDPSNVERKQSVADEHR